MQAEAAGSHMQVEGTRMRREAGNSHTQAGKRKELVTHNAGNSAGTGDANSRLSRPVWPERSSQ
jgi:hypothetical protein